MGRRTLLAVVVVLGGVVSVGFAPAGTKAPTACGPTTAKTLRTGQKVRVYSLPNSKFPESERVYACLVGVERNWRLERGRQRVPFGGGWPTVDTGVLAVHAPWVAYPERFSGVDTSVLTLAAKNLRTGATSYCFVGFHGIPRSVVPSVTGIVLRRNGHRAWIGETAERHEVAACPSTELEVESVEIERNGGIDLHSLALHGSTLTWTYAGESRSAVLR